MRKMRKIVFLVILVNFVMSQNSTSSDNKNSSVNSTEKSARYDNTDEETAKVLAEFEKRSDVMLCIGIFSRIPQDYIAKKVKPMKEVIKKKSEFGKYVDKYIFNAMATCLKMTKNAEKEKVKIFIFFSKNFFDFFC